MYKYLNFGLSILKPIKIDNAPYSKVVYKK